MEKGFALVAVVLSCGAMSVMVSRMQNGDDVGAYTGPDAEGQIGLIKKEVTTLNRKLEQQNMKLQQLRDRLMQVEEAANGVVESEALRRQVVLTQLVQRIDDAVKREMDVRLQKRRNRDKAMVQVAGNAKAKGGGNVPAPGGKKQILEQKFNIMINNIKVFCQLDPNRVIKTRNEMNRAREALNIVWRRYREIDAAKRTEADVNKRQADLATQRRQIDTTFKREFTDTQYRRYLMWTRMTKDVYTRKFLGLEEQ